MKTILFVYPPFCSAAAIPYSITYLASFIKNNTNKSSYNVELLDLNLKFSHVSIRKLESWKKWDKEHPRRKPGFVALTHLSQKSIDSKGKTYFSRKKKASNFSADDD